MERLYDGLLLLIVSVLLTNSSRSLGISDNTGEDWEFITRADAVVMQHSRFLFHLESLWCIISATAMLLNAVAAVSLGALTTPPVTVELCGSITHSNVLLFAFAAIAQQTLVMMALFYLLIVLHQLLLPLLLLFFFSSPALFEQPCTV